MTPGSGLEQHPLLPWLALQHTRGIGPVRAAKLLEQLGPRWFLSPRLPDCGLSEAQLVQLLTPSWSVLEPLLEWQRQGPARHILSWDHPAYPELLKTLSGAPLLLFVEGDPDALSLPQLAVVGTRHPSYVGKENTRNLVTQLVDVGAAITSGLAIGVDGLGHQAALERGGVTLAVLGSGLEQCYPKRHRRLAGDIVDGGGALISECYPWEAPQAHHFPRRNRIISGLSLGVLVVEAAERSGSLITARFALEQGREVFAIPGAWQNPQAGGCNRLIQQGAKLVCEVNDILEELVAFSTAALKIHPPATEELLPYPDLLDNVGLETTAVDLIASRCQQPVQEVVTRLVELELAGWVESVPGGYVRARRS
ncbi:DNA-protecting protein DprA [Zobellella endophytica]|uniref:DNA-protecting protein DprA n=1 Tax=Zobellella endophytica TaxID=2116700 RepID=A0A2P7QWU2_9GAMM|nr:DNA-processing protein DprA [Zobellella endophytica]PSJ42450.1 DNA-protecting protein DprA [Zobellella endophytica]